MLTPEGKAREKFGYYAKKKGRKGKVISPQAKEAGNTDNWQQGSDIIVNSPEISELTHIIASTSRTQRRESLSTAIL